MALSYDTRRIKYFDENPDELYVEIKESPEYSYQDLNPETKALVFGSMVTDIGDLTINTASDYYARWKIMEKYSNFVFLSLSTGKGWEDIYLTPNIIVKHIGLSTNVAKLSRNLWLERIFSNFSKDRDMEHKPNKAELSKTYSKMVEEFENSWLSQKEYNNG